MSTLKSNAKEIIYTIDRFRGINESADGSAEAKRGEASYMRNYRITDGGALAVRPGMKLLPSYDVESPIRAMWGGTDNDEEILICLCGDKLYLNYEEGFAKFPEMIQEITIADNAVANIFFFGGKYYLLTGTGFYDLGARKTVEGYVPTIVIAAAPDGNGTLYEQVNKLTAKRKVRYSADGKSTKYYLPETGLTEILSVTIDGQEKSNPKDYIVSKTSRYEYGNSITRTCVEFTTAPEAGTDNIEIMYTLNVVRTFAFSVPAGESTIDLSSAFKTFDIVTDIFVVAKENESGGVDTLTYSSDYTYSDDNTKVFLTSAPLSKTTYYVSIEFEKNYREEVFAMTKSEVYNGAQDTRLFLYGDGGNVALYSGLDENGKGTAEYFPDLNEIEIGDANTPITAMIRHRNRLLAFKPNAAYSIYYSATSLEDGNLIPGFYLNAINREIGCADGANAVSVENRVRTLCHKSIYEWRSTNSSGNITSDARNAEVVSARVRDTIKSFDMSKCIQLYDNINNEYYCFCGNKAVIHNTVSDAWYVYDELLRDEGETITSAAIFDSKVCFGATDGRIRYFDRTAACDDTDKMISAEWNSLWLDFGKPHYQKYSPKLWVSGISAVKNGDGNVSVKVETDSYRGDKWRNIYFQNDSRTPQTRRSLNKIPTFLYYMLKIKTQEDEDHATITGAVIRVNYTIPIRH